jgi:putative PIN family toxin of toxin-antitoxin system
VSVYVAVLVTNLLVSYLVTSRPPIASLIDDHLAQDHFVLVTAPELLEELDRVLAYPRLGGYTTQAERRRFVASFTALSEVVDLPETIPRLCRDLDDDWVIAFAVVGEVDVIVSGDRDLLSLNQVGGIVILTASGFLEMLERDG